MVMSNDVISLMCTSTELYFFLFAEKLPILLPLCVFCNCSVHLRVCLLLGLCCENNAWGKDHGVESIDQDSCLNHTDNLQFLITMVCGRPNSVPFIPYQ